MDFSIIPEDIVLDIISRCACDGIDTIRNVRLVSQQFRGMCDKDEVLSKINLDEVPFYIFDQNPNNFNNFYRRLCDSGNPVALYRTGIRHYFCDSEITDGLEKLRQASELGVYEASFVYGMICVCLGGGLKERGYNALKKLLQTTLCRTLAFVRIIRENVMLAPTHLGWIARGHIYVLRLAYTREECQCNGTHLEIIPPYEGWQFLNDPQQSQICTSCFWEYQFNLIFEELF